jgi:hypothetical protein
MTERLEAAARQALEEGAQVIALTVPVRETVDVSAPRGRLTMTASAISGRTKKRGLSWIMRLVRMERGVGAWISAAWFREYVVDCFIRCAGGGAVGAAELSGCGARRGAWNRPARAGSGKCWWQQGLRNQ